MSQVPRTCANISTIPHNESELDWIASEQPISLAERVAIVFKGGVPENLVTGYSGYGLLGQ